MDIEKADLTSPKSIINATEDTTLNPALKVGTVPTAQAQQNTEKRTTSVSKMKAKSKTRKSPLKQTKTQEPVTGNWDVLPHGLGQIGALEDGSAASIASTSEISAVIRRSSVATASGGKSPTNGRRRKPGNDKTKDVLPTLTEDRAGAIASAQQNTRPKRKTVKSEEKDTQDKDFAEEQPMVKRVKATKKVIETPEKVVIKDEELIETSGNIENSETRRKKAHPYGLTPGKSPFPDWPMPTQEACEEVNRLLSELHGEVKPPQVIPPPSMEVTGCGEVPDLLDAILRTLLSASTTANNSNRALKGLKEKFGLRTEGVGIGSVNWEAVHKADLPTVVDAIKEGGLANVKGKNIKKILDAVYAQNLDRHKKGLKPGGEEKSMLSMDYIFEMTTDEAMEEMIKLPGIGVKTASCVILFCMKRPSFAVDTHVWRHCKWLGWVPHNATRDQTFSHCEVRIPDDLKYSLHQLFLRHGKTCGRCRANTTAGTEEWNKTVCPIDHLVNRKEPKKLLDVKLDVKLTTSKSVVRTKVNAKKNKPKRLSAKKADWNYSDDEWISQGEDDEDEGSEYEE